MHDFVIKRTILLCALLIPFLITGCSIANYSVHGLSQLQSPLTYRQARNYPAGAKNLYRLEDRVRYIPNEEEKKKLNAGDDWKAVWNTDRFSDLIERRKLLGLSLSGGGARASYFAAKVLRDIEIAYRPKYLHKEITFYSSVSGGSIVNSFIGAWKHADHHRNMDAEFLENDGLIHNKSVEPFEWIYSFMREDEGFSKRCGNLGDIASQVVLDPRNLGMPTLFSLFTNQGYSRYLSLSVEYCLRYLLSQNGITKYRSFNELISDIQGSFTLSTKYSPFKLDDLGGDGSRHYINATILETGQRLVFANKEYHIHSKRVAQQRLSDIVFFEDLYGSVKEFSIADATVASMSFPGATEPVIFQVYDGPFNKDNPPKSVAQIQIVDGGIFENTGLETLLNVMFDEVVTTDAKDQELVVLLIDADNGEYKTLADIVEKNTAGNNNSLVSSAVGLNLPIKGIGEGIKSALLIHDLNKKRAMRLMFYDSYRKLEELNESGRKISLKIIPISLGSLIHNPDLEEVWNVSTYYSISNHSIEVLEKATETLLKMNYGEALKTFKERYFFPQDSFAYSLLYHPDNLDEEVTLKEVIIDTIPTDYQEIIDKQNERECQKLKKSSFIPGGPFFYDKKCKRQNPSVDKVEQDTIIDAEGVDYWHNLGITFSDDKIEQLDDWKNPEVTIIPDN